MSFQDGGLSWLGGKSRECRRVEAIDAATFPPGRPTPAEIDSLIAKEMTRLSMDEREKALDDVHGIGKSVNEEPAFVSTILQELENHLNVIKWNTAYAEAEALSTEYVVNHDFRMMFLRSEQYTVKDAAERMIRFFDLKQALFGTEKLVKDITLEDLDEDDTECLTSGYAQISPKKDSAGRTIVIFLQKLRKKFKVVENVVRAISDSVV
jgi:hypothetical protein